MLGHILLYRYIYHFLLTVHSYGHIRAIFAIKSFGYITRHHEMRQIAVHDVAHSSLAWTSGTTRGDAETPDSNATAIRYVMWAYIPCDVTLWQ